MTQEQLDRLTFDMYVDCGLNATETARQMGIARSTVKARVRRESLRMSARRMSAR